MIKNFFKFAFRNLLRQRVFSTINILGLAIGLAVCLVISFYVIDDLTYDSFHKNAKYIYHLLSVDSAENEGALSYSVTAGPLVETMAENIPEVEVATRVTRFSQVGFSRVLESHEEQIDDKMNLNCLVADNEFFNVFDFRILSGNIENPLVDLHGIYLTPSIADALFPKEDPIGKPILNDRIDNAYVAGIVQECPMNSHLQYQAILPLDVQIDSFWMDNWENLKLIGYFRINKNADPLTVKEKIEDYAHRSGFPEVVRTDMQPLLDVHLGSADLCFDYLNSGKNDRMKVYMLALIAMLVLIIATINFVNLSSAQAIHRAKEVGIRKIAGGKKSQLFIQFLSESVITSFLAIIIALALFEIALPHLNVFLQKNLSYNLIENYQFTILLVAVYLVTGIVAGIYPSLVLTRFEPISIITGNFSSSSKGIFIRRILVVCQFAVSTALIISVLIVLQQINYLNSIDLGYNRENVLVVPNPGSNETGAILKEKLKNLSFVESAAVISNTPGGSLTRLDVVPEGFDEDNRIMFDQLMVDDNLTETLQFRLLEGRDFSPEFPSDVQESILINESACKILGWENPIGKTIELGDNKLQFKKTIIGIIEDVNFSTTRQKVNPMLLVHSDQSIPRVLLKLKPGQKEQALEEIKRIFASLYPEGNSNFQFLDDFFNTQFSQDRSFASNIAVFSILAILIACLGLFGLASFASQQRQREVAIRKVLGASANSVVFLLVQDFTRWVLVANIIAWPVTYFIMQNWLTDFAYKTQLNFVPFIAAGFITLLISILTIGLKMFRVAHINPAKIINYE